MAKKTAAEIVDSKQLQSLWTLVENLDVCCYIKDTAGRFTFVNRAVRSLFGTPASSILGASNADFVDLDRSFQMELNDQLVLKRGEKAQGEEELFLLNGKYLVFWSVKLPLYDAKHNIVGLCGISTDITQQRSAIDQIVERNELLNAILKNIDAAIYLKDINGKYLYANQKAVQFYNRSLNEIIGQTDQQLLPPEVAASLQQFDSLVFASASRQAREEILFDAHGDEHHFWTVKVPLQLPAQPLSLIGFATDITELLGLRKLLESRRITDPLTGLPNRVRFESVLEEQLSTAKPDKNRFAVVLIDLDQFKYVNNSLGQQIGDQLIREVGVRLQQCRVNIVNLARMAGDEFAFILQHVASPEDAAASVEQIRALLSLPYPLLHQPLHMTVSAGVSLYPDDAQNCGELLRHAEAAMYSAKERGRDQYRFYSTALGETVVARLELERDLRSAVTADEFELHYQPKMRRDGSIAGFEALIRWNRRGHGLISPTKFIPLAEQLALLPRIGTWVIEQACRQIAEWREIGIGEVPIAVNLSTGQLTSPALLDNVFRLLGEYEIVDGCLEMEVTESMMIADPELAISMLHKLRTHGIPLSIDDFGTGFSSMAYLRQLPVNTLKLDRSFVTNVADDSKDADLCAGIIALAHKLDMKVVAEGVETSGQRESLVTCDCDLFQGYLFSRPLPAAKATEFLRNARVQ